MRAKSTCPGRQTLAGRAVCQLRVPGKAHGCLQYNYDNDLRRQNSGSWDVILATLIATGVGLYLKRW